MNKLYKNGHLKLPVVFIITAVSTLVLIMAGAYIYQIFWKKDELGPNSYDSSFEENIEKDDEYTASMEYSGNVTINSNDNSIKLYFKNPAKSRKSVSLEIIGEINGQNVSIAKVKKIMPGEEIRDLKYDVSKGIEKGKYKGKFILHFYNDEGVEEIVNSAIIVDIIVN